MIYSFFIEQKTKIARAFFFSLLSSVASLQANAIELHAHLFMKQGLGAFFQGDFEDPIQAKDWTARLSSNANHETLEQSGARIVVAALYALPYVRGDLRQAIREQIEIAERFVKNHPKWIIAKSPAEARSALSEGKKTLILSLEGASGIIESDDDWIEFVDKKGIRIITFLHLTDDDFGGVALLRGIFGLSSPLSWLEGAIYQVKQFWNRKSVDLPATKMWVQNPHGLSDRGREWIKKALKHQAWIDFAHTGDFSFQDAKSELKGLEYPLLVTHGSIREYQHSERATSQEMLEEIQKSRGVFGILPSESMLAGTPIPDCSSGLERLHQNYIHLMRTLTPEQVMIGSDWNGAIDHLSPTCKDAGGKGVWNLAQLGQLYTALNEPLLENNALRQRREEHFLSAWEKARNIK